MSYNFEGGPQRPESGLFEAGRRGRLALVQKIYGLFLLGVLAAVTTGQLLLMTPTRDVPFHGQTIAAPAGVLAVASGGWLVFIAAFGLLFLLRVVGRTPGVNVAVMLAFCAAMGAFVTPRVFIATVLDGPETVNLAGAMTALMFVGLSTYAFLSKVDFNFLGAGLFVALWGLIIGGLLNLFFQSPWAHMFMAWIGLVVFSGFVLFDTSLILRRARDEDAVVMAIELFLDALNLFLLLLDIFGGRRR